MGVTVRREGAVVVVTLNRAEQRNALDRATMAGIADALDEAGGDRGVTAVVITGAGERAFSAGMDLKEFATRDRTSSIIMERYREFLQGRFPKPVIAAVNGAAVAGGLELMLGCDLAVAAEHAVFGIPEVKRGLVAAGGGLLLPLRLPLAVALELGLTGDTIDAARALQLGLVNRVVPGPAVVDEALRLAERIGENGPLAVALTKKVMYEVHTYGGADAWERMTAANPQVFESDDALEGARAFAERRRPVWKGR
jgi:enoyl-CoA hydratase/carnithine racemase